MNETVTKSDAANDNVPIVERLLEIARKQDRGTLAALRTGCGKPPGTAARMFPIVAPFLTGDDGPSTHAAFITAALFAKHPEHASVGSLGYSLWKATRSSANPNGKHGEEGVERRFVAALDAHPEDLYRHLEGLVSLCQSASVPIDWHRFYRDVRALLSDWTDKENPTRLVRDKVRMRWARDFWRGSSKVDHFDESTQEENDK